jgi:hypothetical protein
LAAPSSTQDQKAYRPSQSPLSLNKKENCEHSAFHFDINWRLLWKINKQERAIKVWSAAIARTELDSPWVLIVRGRVGSMRLRQRKWAEAEASYREI